MARLGRKKLYLDFTTDPEMLEKIEKIRKKVKASLVIRMSRPGKMEIDIKGAKEDVQYAIATIKEILKG